MIESREGCKVDPEGDLPNIGKTGQQIRVYEKTIRIGTFNLAVIEDLRNSQDQGTPIWLRPWMGLEETEVEVDEQLIRAIKGGISGAYMEFTRRYRVNRETGEVERIIDGKAVHRAGQIIAGAELRRGEVFYPK